MSIALVWTNLMLYSLQIGLLVGLAAMVPAMLRLRLPAAKLLYWQILLGACLLVPLVRPWKQEVVVSNVEVSTRMVAVGSQRPASGGTISWNEIGLLVLAAGALARLGWLGTGFVRLRHYRRHSRAFETPFAASAGLDLRISDDVAGPVTFGLRKPVILLPPRFPQLKARLQEAILTHELLHVERSDWLFTVGEEVVRAVLWFHPAIWWLLSEIQLAREQAVDETAVERTDAPQEYVDALLAMAGARQEPDLAPASLFLQKRHLKQRVISIFQEVRMSKKRLISMLAVALVMMGAACWLVTGALPLAAAPQVVADAPGVSVDLNGAPLMHRSPVGYPAEALAKGIEGTVVVQVKIDARGEVSDASVVSGPQELRRAVLASALAWHFAKEAAPSTRTVAVAFALPESAKTATHAPAMRNAPWPPGMANPSAAHVVTSITVTGISDQSREALLAALPIREGDSATGDQVLQLMNAVRQFDEHLRTTMIANSDGTASFRIVVASASHAPATAADSGEPPARLRIGGDAQQAKLISQVAPAYPPEAKQARIQGLVRMEAVIAKDGTVTNLKLLEGNPELAPAAMEAVKQWVYAPTLLNGNPVEVITKIDVNFTLSH
jgi:TonB family protein